YPKVKDEKPGDITNGEKAGSVLAGTEELPYEIRSIEDLLAIYNSSLDINGGAAFVTLMVNLDFNNKDSYSDSSRIDYGDINGDKKVTSLKDELTNRSGSGFNPVFSSNVSGSGPAAIYFDGNAKTINNLYINRPSMDNVGLFSLMMGQINGLNLLNINIKGRDNVGGIIGQGGFFMINNCKVTGNITGETQVGLVAGYTDLVEIRQVIASGNVKSTLEVSTNDRPVSSGVIAGTAIRNGSVKQTGIFLGGSIKSSDNWCVSLVGKGLMTGYVNEDSLINNQHSFCYNANAISAAELRTDVPYKELGFNFTETDPLKEKYIWYMENGKAKLKKN
ncbi:MAG: GLUG motif-containing protein, partial [Bacilli bacterium]